MFRVFGDISIFEGRKKNVCKDRESNPNLRLDTVFCAHKPYNQICRNNYVEIERLQVRFLVVKNVFSQQTLQRKIFENSI